MVINGYALEAELQNANSGFSKWGFAKKYGKSYFIKELINPVYPTDRSIMSEEMFAQRCAKCVEYENRFKTFYNAINNASCGNLVRIDEFFRSGSRYYLITEKIEEKSVPLSILAGLPENKKILLLKTVANGFYRLHSAGIVHFDVKPANILVKKTRNGNYAGKLIDFDAGFFIGEDIENSELGGDLTYLAPETCRALCGEDVRIDEKADIFALGLVFHQYCTGKLPYYNTAEYEYPYESVLDDCQLVIDKGSISPQLCALIESMLAVDPAKRPSAGDIFNTLNAIEGATVPNVDPTATVVVNAYTGSFGGSGSVRGSRFKGSLSMMGKTESVPLTGTSIPVSAPVAIDPARTAPVAPVVPVAPAEKSPWFTSAGDL